jgi:hypothetical protein
MPLKKEIYEGIPPQLVEEALEAHLRAGTKAPGSARKQGLERMEAALESVLPSIYELFSERRGDLRKALLDEAHKALLPGHFDAFKGIIDAVLPTSKR